MSNYSGVTYVPNFVPNFSPLRSQGFTPQGMMKFQKTGGSQTFTRTIKKKRRGPMRNNSFKRRVLNVFPAKHLSGQTAVTINNAEIYTMNLTQQITQGDLNSNRDGDSVQLEALKMEGFIQTATASNAYRFRIMVGYSGEEYGSANLATGLLTDAELFLPNTTSTVSNGIVNPKAFTQIYDEVIDLNSQIEGDRTIQSTKFTLKLNKKFPYQASGSIYGKTQNLYVIVISYAADTAAGTANGSAVLSYDLIFKD